jgi:hypothetical protein
MYGLRRQVEIGLPQVTQEGLHLVGVSERFAVGYSASAVIPTPVRFVTLSVHCTPTEAQVDYMSAELSLVRYCDEVALEKLLHNLSNCKTG